MSELTASQTRVLKLIQRLIAETGVPPTRAEIARKLGFKSANAAQEHLRSLAHKGLIELRSGSARGIRLREQDSLPVIAQVAAGRPLLAEAHIEERYQLDPNLFAPGADYLLRVRGMSMRDAGILDDDLLAVHRTTTVRAGQIVVVRIDDEVTVKRYRREGDKVRLMPENADFAPLVVDLTREPLVIEGVVVGVIRNGRAL